MRERHPDPTPKLRARQMPGWTAPDAAAGDGANLAADDYARPGLTRNARGDGHVTGIPLVGAGGGYRADRQKTRPMKGLVGDDQRATGAGLLVPFNGIQPNDDDAPAQRRAAQAGHVSRSALR